MSFPVAGPGAIRSTAAGVRGNSSHREGAQRARRGFRPHCPRVVDTGYGLGTVPVALSSLSGSTRTALNAGENHGNLTCVTAIFVSRQPASCAFSPSCPVTTLHRPVLPDRRWYLRGGSHCGMTDTQTWRGVSSGAATLRRGCHMERCCSGRRPASTIRSLHPIGCTGVRHHLSPV